jgi:hypothetical protein
MFVFFIRSFNDVDHMAPIVYRLALEGETVQVLCQDLEYDIAKDFRLQHLTAEFANVFVQYVYAAHVPTALHRLFVFGHGMYNANKKSVAASLFRLRVKSFIQGVLGLAFRKCIWGWPRWRKFLLKRWYGEGWARQCLEHLQTSVVVFDYVIGAEHFVTTSLLQAAGRLGIPSVGVAPGVPIFAEGYLPENDFFVKEVETPFDYNIVPHAGAAAYRTQHGVDATRITVLGSPRFCSEWQTVLDAIVPPPALSVPHAAGQVRVVYMERGADLHGDFRQTIADTISRLSRLDWIQLVIKPHPRTNRFHAAEQGRSVTVATQENSLNLINWADVVIGTNTSILIDALIRGKVLLYPKYFHADRMIFDTMGACLRVNSYEELETGLRKLHAHREAVPYPEENVTRLLEYLGGLCRVS